MSAQRRFKQWLVLGLALVTFSATAAQAADRPDNRQGPRGANAAAVTSSATRPDDRASGLGVGTQQLVTDQSDVVSRYLNNHPAAVRPDDRAGIRGVGTGNGGLVTPALPGGGSFWDVVGLAAGSSLGALAVALAGFALIRHRRSAATALQS
jgi:hypothetical protein